MSKQDVKPGTRVHWKGDMANMPASGTIVALDGAFMFVRFDGEEQARPMPAMLLSTPRWSVIE